MHHFRRLYRIVPAGLRGFLKRKVIRKLPQAVFKRRLVSLNVPGLYAYYTAPYDKDLLHEAQARTGEKLAEPEENLFVCGLRDVYLRLDRGLVEVKGGQILVESSFVQSKTLRVATMTGNPKGNNIPWLEGKTYATAITMFDRNYYHWFIDTLPRLYLFESLRLEEPLTLLMPADLKEYQVKSLDCCLPQNMTVEYVNCEGVRIERLLMPSYVRARTNLYVPIEHLDYVRNAVLRRFGPSDSEATKYGRRIYVSRALASRRRVLNEDAVVACLAKHGFTVVHAEKLTLEEQVAQFRAAEWIVGPHGAGLTNMLFSKQASIIEFLGDFGPSGWYFRRLASTLEHTHHFLTAKQRKKNADMVVDVASLERTLVALGL